MAFEKLNVSLKKQSFSYFLCVCVFLCKINYLN